MPFISGPAPVPKPAPPVVSPSGTVSLSSEPGASKAPGPTVPTFRHHLLAIALALIGGPLGVLGAIAQEQQAGPFVFVGAAVIEEALKPAGIYVLLVKWPYALRGRIYTAGLTAVSGLVFALLEAAAYIFLYFPEGRPDFVLYRLTVPLFMHTFASFIFGLGIKRQLVDWAMGVAPFPKDSGIFTAAAMALHATFNIVAVILALTGVIDFEKD